MEKIKGLAIELDLDHLSVDRGLKGLKDNLRTVNSEMRRNMSAFDRSDRSVKKYETRLDGLNKKYEVQKRAVEEARKEYEEMVKEYGHGSKEAEKAAREYNNQAAALNNLERYIEKTTIELQKLEREQRIANSGWTKLGENLEKASSKLRSASERMGQVGSTLTNKITKPAVGAATALASLTLFKGFQRLIGIDTAKAQLKALGHDAKEVDQIMQAALNSVKGTSHGMDEAATTAASAVAAGVDPVKDLERYLSLAADTASVANVPFAEMGAIFNKVQTSGKAQNDVLTQLSERGIPIYQYLAETLNKTTEEIQEMAREGEISTKDFLKAVEKNIGGASKVIGEESFAAAIKNVGADISRIGANFLESGEDGKGFFSTIKPMLVDFRNWLGRAEDKAADLGVKFGQAFEKMVEKAKELKRQYDELSPAQQDFVKRVLMIAPAVAVGAGPAITIFSKLTAGISSALDFTSRLSKAIGVARSGAGLAAALTALGPGAAAGLAVAGITAVGGAIYLLTRESNRLHEISTETADAMMEQHLTNIEIIDSFDELRQKSRLTNDEFARYLDLHTRLENESDPEAIKAIKDEMAELQEKSGLSNKELDKMVGYNNTLVDTLPESTAQITEQGNRIADSTENLREYNQELAAMAKRELEAELHKSLANEIELREQIKEAQVELNALEEAETGIREIINAQLDGTIETVKERLLQEKELLEDAYREAVMRGEVTDQLSAQIDVNEALLSMADQDVLKNREKLSEIMNQVDGQRELIKEKQNDLNKTGEIVAKMIEYELIAAGISEETARKAVKDAEVSGLLDKQLQSLREQKQELYNQATPAERLTEQFQESVDNINEQIRGLENAKSNIQDLISEAGEYNKELAKDVNKMVKVQTDPTPTKLDSLLTKTLVRRIDVHTNLPQAIRAHAQGTPSHPGGPAILGDGTGSNAGSELVTLPSGKSFLSANRPTLYPNLPKGTQVIPAKKTRKLFSSIPNYANGTRNWASALGNSEFARLLTTNARTSETRFVNRGERYTSEMVRLLVEQNEHSKKIIDLLIALLGKDLDIHKLTYLVNEVNAVDDLAKVF